MEDITLAAPVISDVDEPPVAEALVNSWIISRCSALAALASLVFRRLGNGVKQNFVSTAFGFSVGLAGQNSFRMPTTKSSSQKCSLQTRAFLSFIGGSSNQSLASHYSIPGKFLGSKYIRAILTCFSKEGLFSGKR